MALSASQLQQFFTAVAQLLRAIASLPEAREDPAILDAANRASRGARSARNTPA